METAHLPFIAAAGLLAGGAIGLAFGALQKSAQRRYEKLQGEGRFNSGWAAMPGSFRRVAYLLVALVVVQLACPAIFAPGGPAPWFVSAGVVLGYGWTLFEQLRRRLA